MTTATTPEVTKKKRAVLNTLAIIGFFALVGLIAWLSLWFVQVLPGAFSSLASTFESLYGRSATPQTITISPSTDSVRSGDVVVLQFNEERGEGTYTFNYECFEGVTLTLLDGQNEQALRCEVVYSLGTLTEATLKATSENVATIAIPYSITFLKNNDTKARAGGTGTITVTNGALASTQPPVSSATVVEVTIAPPVTTTATTTPPRTPPRTSPRPTVAPTYQTVSYVPVSDENGYSDLAVSFIELGEVAGGRLVSKNTLTRNTENFFRFEIKNIGSKTSAAWSFTTTLPGDNITVRDKQAPLLPNERAIITVRFPVDGNKTYELLRVESKVSADTTSTNNLLLRVAEVI